MGLGTHAVLAILLVVVVLKTGLSRRSLFGPIPSRRDVIVYVLLGIPLIGIAILCIYAVYIPLSYAFPNFVEWWVLDEPPVIWWRWDYEAITGSAINILASVLLAPVVEELFFRGFLLNRWRSKYGATKAVAFSSIAFGALHVDVLGGIVFGVVLSLIYLRTQSLVAPIIVHMANNAIVVIALVAEGLWSGSLETMTLWEFRKYWWLAMLGALIGIPWLYRFIRKLFEGAYDAASPAVAADCRSF